VIWVVLGFFSAGLLWPPQGRKWIWNSSKEEVSLKKTIQEIKNIVAFEGKKSKLEDRLNSMVEQIKQDIKSKNGQMIKSIIAFEDKESKLEARLKKMMSKHEVELNSLKMQMMEDTNSLKMQMKEDTNSLKMQMMQDVNSLKIMINQLLSTKNPQVA
jgi:molybdopterin-biosynthesis enzyme MoeA-like protein